MRDGGSWGCAVGAVRSSAGRSGRTRRLMPDAGRGDGAAHGAVGAVGSWAVRSMRGGWPCGIDAGRRTSPSRATVGGDGVRHVSCRRRLWVLSHGLCCEIGTDATAHARCRTQGRGCAGGCCQIVGGVLQSARRVCYNLHVARSSGSETPERFTTMTRDKLTLSPSVNGLCVPRILSTHLRAGHCMNGSRKP